MRHVGLWGDPERGVEASAFSAWRSRCRKRWNWKRDGVSATGLALAWTDEALKGKEWRTANNAKECIGTISFTFWLSFHFSRGQNRKSPSSVFLCSETKRKRLLRRLREVQNQAPFSWLVAFWNHPKTADVQIKSVNGGWRARNPTT